jgi:hypothetical protein
LKRGENPIKVPRDIKGAASSGFPLFNRSDRRSFSEDFSEDEEDGRGISGFENTLYPP